MTQSVPHCSRWLLLLQEDPVALMTGPVCNPVGLDADDPIIRQVVVGYVVPLGYVQLPAL